MGLSTKCSMPRALSGVPGQLSWRRRTRPKPADALGVRFIDQGITFSLSGQERPFTDLVPRVKLSFGPED